VALRLPEPMLELVALYARHDDAKFERAAVRWLVRLTEERRLALAQVQLAAGALATLRAKPKRAQPRAS
jgi:hypothetical protein